MTMTKDLQIKKVISDIIKFTSAILDMDMPTITYKSLPAKVIGRTISADEIIIDLDHMEKGTELFTILHEIRHAYQLSEIELYKTGENFEESKTIQTWQNNINDYINYSLDENKFKVYEIQPIELDANAFALAICQEVFKIKIVFHNKTDDYMNKLKKAMLELNITKDDINYALAVSKIDINKIKAILKNI